MAFGVYLFRKNPTRALHAAQVNANSYWSDVVTGFLLTFSNPLILFFIIGLFARFTYIQPEYTPWHYLAAYASIFTGAVGWWYGVTLLVSKLRKRINVRSLKIINRVIGMVLIAMAAVGLAVAVADLIMDIH